LALPALVTAAEAQSADWLDGVALALPPFPSMPPSLYDSASAQVLLTAASDAVIASDEGAGYDSDSAQFLLAAADAAGAPVEGASGPEASEPAAPPAPTPGTGAPPPPPTTGSFLDGLDPDSPYTQLLALGSALGGPAWVVIPQASIAQYATDNAAHSNKNRQFGTNTRLRGIVALRGDTPRIQAGLVYSLVYRKGFGATSHNDGLSQVGSGMAHTIAIPDFLFVDVNASAREIQRLPYGDVNFDILNRSETTQVYTASVSPDAKWEMGSLGYSDLRYAYSHIWVERNTGPIVTSSGVLGAITDGTIQMGRYDFHMPETIVTRLVSDVLGMAADHDMQGRIGRFKRASGELINEYAFSESLSGIVVGGYESLNNARFPLASGEGAIWNVGGRWRPNVDSSILVLYGSQDLRTSIRGQATYRITPVTMMYASYVNGITTSQGAYLGATNSSTFGLDDQGPLTSVGYEDDPTISALDGGGSFGFGGFGGGGFGGGGGFPLFSAGNISATQNGIFRRKAFIAGITTNVVGDRISLRGYHAERESLTGPNFIEGGVLNIGGASPIGNLISTGATLSWTHYVMAVLPVTGFISFKKDNIDNGETWSVGAYATYQISPTFGARLRFDSIYRQAEAGRGFDADVISIQLTKTFE
jgi:uncharacterized protein (PEP-CTERM system associated)